jgi:hypothetical protein
VEYVKAASLREAPALLANIRQGWKSSPGTDNPAYYDNTQITTVKCFITYHPGLGAWSNPEVRPWWVFQVVKR